MPLKEATGSEKETQDNFNELRHGKTYAKTQRKYGKKRAQKQMIAIALKTKREAKRKKGRRKRG
jgi:hypothetical protein